MSLPKKALFSGDVYDPYFDESRLTGQLHRVFKFMKDGKWRTLDEINIGTNDPHSSISAQLRHLRKEKFGSHLVNKRPKGDRFNGLWEYQLIVSGGKPAGKDGQEKLF